MTTPLIESVAAAIVAAGIGQQSARTTEWYVSLGYMDDQPDRLICIYDSPGRPPEETMRLGYPDIQVRVRGAKDDYAATAVKMRAIFALLHGGEAAVNAHTDAGEGVVFLYAKHSAPIPMGVDEKRRPGLAWNFRTAQARSVA